MIEQDKALSLVDDMTMQQSVQTEPLQAIGSSVVVLPNSDCMLCPSLMQHNYCPDITRC